MLFESFDYVGQNTVKVRTEPLASQGPTASYEGSTMDYLTIKCCLLGLPKGH